MFSFGGGHDLEIVHLLYGLVEFGNGMLAAKIETIAQVQGYYPSILTY